MAGKKKNKRRKQRGRESFQLLYLKTCSTILFRATGPNGSYPSTPLPLTLRLFSLY